MSNISILPADREVQAMRASDSIGLQDARRRIMKRNAITQIEMATTVDDLRAILRQVLQHLIH